MASTSSVETMHPPDETSTVGAPNNESQEGITVAIRMRPLNKTEGNGKRIWKVLPKYKSVTQTTDDGKPLSERVTGRTFFTFDKVFGEDADTPQVYESVAKGIVTSVVSGLNGTIFAYGQTSSGKTFTMQGSGSIQDGASSLGGVVHMAASDIFSQIESQQDRIFLVRASFLEIYNEEVRDLLSESNHTLQIREDPRRGVFVQAQEEIVTDFEGLLTMLFRGEKSRAIASTQMNERSSRSHTIFRITIESREKPDETEGDDSSSSSHDGAVRISTLNLVDLAGSESVRHTGATGERQKEGGMINQSLLTLSRVIVSLGQPNQTHINFRDSKLTRILQPSLSGNARMAVICCATPSEMYLEETRSTLQFASRAKLVKTNAQVNEVLDDRSIIRRLQRELAEARRQSSVPEIQSIRALENKAASAGTAAIEAKAKLDRLKASILNASYLFSSRISNHGKENITPSALDVGSEIEYSTRKRRHSEGILRTQLSSPNSKNKEPPGTPSTAPRKKKERKLHPPELSPKSELDIVRQALSTRNKLTKTLRATLSTHSNQIRSQADTLSALSSENTGLRDENSKALSEIASLRDSLTSVQANLQDTITEYDLQLEEKDSSILAALGKLEETTREKDELEESNASLQTQLHDLQQRFEKLQEERVRSAFALAQSLEEKETFAHERERDKQALQEMNGKLSQLTTELNDGDQQLCLARENILKLQRAMEALKDSNKVSEDKIVQLKSEIASNQAKAADERSQVQVALDETKSKLDAAIAEKEGAFKRISELQEALECSKADFSNLEATATVERQEASGAIEGLQKKVDSLFGENKDMENHLSSLKSDYSLVQAQLVELERKKETLEEEYTRQRASYELLTQELRGELETSNREKNDRMDRIAVLEEELKAANDRAHNAAAAAVVASSEAEAAQKELQVKLDLVISDNERERQCAQAASEEAAQYRKQAENTMSNLRDQLDSLAMEHSGALARVSTAEDELKYMHLELSQAQTNVAEISTSLTAIEDEKNLLESALSSSLENERLLQSQYELVQKEMGAILQHKESLLEQIEENKASMALLSDEKATLNEILKENKKSARQMTDKLVSQEANIEALQAKVLGLEDILRQWDLKGEELRKNIELHQTEKAEILQRLTRSEKENVSANAELEQIKKDMLNTLQEKEALEFQQKLLQEALTSHQQALNESEARISSLESAKEMLNKGLMDSSQEAEKRLTKVQAALDQALSENLSIQTDNADLRRELQTAQSGFVTLRTEATTKEIEKAELVNQIGSLRNDVERLEKAATKAADENERLQELLSTAIAEKTELNQFLSATEEEAGVVQEEKAQLELELCNVQTVVVSLQEEVDTKAAEIERLSQENAEVNDRMKREIEKLTSNQDQLKAERDRELLAVNDQVLEAEEKIAEFSSKLEEMQKANLDLQLNNNDMLRQVESMEVQRISLESKLMSLQTEKMAALASLDSIAVSQNDEQQCMEDRAVELEELSKQLGEEKENLLARVDSCEKQLQSSNSEMAVLEASKNELQSECNQLRMTLEQQSERIQILQSENEEFARKMRIRDEEGTTLSANISALETKLADMSALSKELEVVRSELNETKRSLQSSENELEQVKFAKENLSESLKAREKERDDAVHSLHDLYNKNKELSQSISDGFTSEQKKSMENEVSELRISNIELKQLLASTVESEEVSRERATALANELKTTQQELEDTQYRLSLVEEELGQVELAFEEKAKEERMSDEHTQRQALLEEIKSLEEAMQKERAEHQRSYKELKKQLGEEQRLLIVEGEKMMDVLRTNVATLEARLRDSEMEAYSARQQLEEAQDEKKSVEHKYEGVEGSIRKLNDTITRQEKELSGLQADLNKSRAECYALKESSIEMKDKVRKASRDGEKAQREKERAESELAALKRKLSNLEQAALEHEMESQRMRVQISNFAESKDRANEYVAKINNLELLSKEKDERIGLLDAKLIELRKEYEKLQREKSNKEVSNQERSDLDVQEVSRLQHKLDQLSAHIRQKDQRIKKLEAVRLTKEQVESIKKMKADNTMFEKQISKLQKENAALHSQLASVDSDSSLQTEISELRFDKQALESKLRKFAAHCQRLEDDKAGMTDALRSCRIDLADYQGDINEAVVSLCDKLVTMEQEKSFDTRRISPSRAKALETENTDLKSQLNNMMESVQTYKSQVADLQSKLKFMVNSTNDKHNDNADKDRKLRFLEQENLQLMLDVKTTKRQLQAAREEMEMLRMNAMENPTVEFSTADFGSDPSQFSKRSSTPAVDAPMSDKKRPSRHVDEMDKENTNNFNKGVIPTRTSMGKSRPQVAAPGLGQAAIEGDDTGECNQS